MPAPASADARREPGEIFGARFTLFADMLAVGVATTVASLPLVTAPAAMAAACTVLRESVRDDRPAGFGRYVDELRAQTVARSVAAGLAVIAAAVLLGFDLLLAGAGLPGARAVSCVLAAVAAAGLVVGLRAVSDPELSRGRRAAFLRAAHRAGADLPGSLLVLVAAGVCAVLVWMLPLLAVLAPGALAFAVTAVELRRGAAPRPCDPAPAGSPEPLPSRSRGKDESR
ncbi:hypothetical protein B1H18_02285 [Streptomyces tsukubensis]|uniref:Uncharacterized protein n=1 Tax=Streptomyces tsukubensis TaxID=83656 RepID=A0A1V4AHX1_9ACTN|nr:hypothetical protein B1H18_02285 [Streptomyces tsukubensis]